VDPAGRIVEAGEGPVVQGFRIHGAPAASLQIRRGQEAMRHLYRGMGLQTHDPDFTALEGRATAGRRLRHERAFLGT
jgi:hypothetical protein